MKLIYLLNGRFPSERAHSVQIMKMCNAFSDVGCDVTLLVSNRDTNVKEDPESYYGEPLLFSWRRVSVIDFVALAGKWPLFLRRFFYFLQKLTFVMNAGKLEQGSILIARDAALLWLLRFKYKNMQLVYESHEAQFNWFTRRLLTQGVKCIVISEGIAEFYRSRGVSDTQMVIAHDAVDESFFTTKVDQLKARKVLDLPVDKKIVMYIGGLQRWKGVESFFHAGSHAPEDVLFVVIGGSKEEIQALKQAYPKIKFLGYRPYRELCRNQQAADVLVLPNTATNLLSSTYTSPLKLFSYLASGVPTVTSDIPSIRNVVGENDVTFFKADDPVHLLVVIERMFSNYETYRQKARMAQQKACQFTWRNRARKILDFL